MVNRYKFIQIWHTARNFKTGSLFFKIALIILAISTLFLVFNFIQIMYIKNILLDKERDYQRLYVDHNIEYINSRLTKIEDFIVSIVVDADFKNILDKYNRKPTSYYEVTSLINNLSKLKTTRIGDSSIYDLFVYVDKLDYVATSSGVTDSRLFFEDKFKNSIDNWNTLINQANFLSVVTADVYDSDSITHTICLLNSLYIKSRRMGTLVVAVDVEDLVDNSSYKDFLDENLVYLLDKNGEIIYCISNIKDDSVVQLMTPALSNANSQIIDDYLVRQEKTAFGNLYLVVFTPIKLITSYATKTFMILIILILGIFIFGITVALYSSQRIYMPLMRVMDFIRVFEQPDSVLAKSEFDFIEKNIAGIISNFDYMEQTVVSSTPLILEAIFKKLIAGEKDIDKLMAMTKDLSINLKNGLYMAIVIQVQCTGSTQKKWDTENFVNLVLLEKIRQYVYDKLISIFKIKENEVVAILFLHQENTLQDVIKNCQSLNESLIKDNCKNACRIGVGAMYSEPYHVGLSYNNAIQAINDGKVNIDNPVFVYNPKGETLSYEDEPMIPFNLESKLFQYVTSGKPQLVADLLDSILKENYEKGISLSSYNKLIYVLHEYALRIFDRLPNEVSKEIGFVNFSAEENHDIKHMNDMIIENYINITDYYGKLNSKGLFAKILDFIDNNLSKDIGLENVASEVGLSVNYLTRYFKKQMGVNFRYYLNSRRIEKAKILLHESKKSVKDISLLCGYNSSQHFILSFSKFVGTTPLEYRRRNQDPSDLI